MTRHSKKQLRLKKKARSIKKVKFDDLDKEATVVFENHPILPKKEPIIVGKVYASWCGHCNALAPHWETMKANMQNMHPSIEIVEIEEGDNMESALKELNHRIGKPVEVTGYPTIFKSPRKGMVEYYGGERTADKIESWILADSQPKTMGGKRKTRRNNRKA